MASGKNSVEHTVLVLMIGFDDPLKIKVHSFKDGEFLCWILSSKMEGHSLKNISRL